MRSLAGLAVFGGGVAQTTLASAVRVAGVPPDLPLIVVVMLALRRGPEFGCLAGFFAGLIQDASGGGPIGVQALTKALAGFAVGALGRGLRVGQPLVQVMTLMLATVAEGLARYAVLQIVRFPAPLGDLLLYVVLPQALYNGFLGAAVVLALAWAEAARARPL